MKKKKVCRHNRFMIVTPPQSSDNHIYWCPECGALKRISDYNFNPNNKWEIWWK